MSIFSQYPKNPIRARLLEVEQGCSNLRPSTIALATVVPLASTTVPLLLLYYS